jgi:hypothetical protein
MVFDPRERPEYLPDWWPWLPDLLPDWSPLSPEFNPEDWIPGKPSWWPDWLPWSPDYIPTPPILLPWNIPGKPDWWPDWLPWTPDYLPGGPSDILPDEPSWWPDWLPWNPFNIKLPENVRTQYSRAETTVYLQALSVQRALYSHRIASRLKSGPVITRNLISNPYPKPPKK